jgi:hypothetical protein
MRTHFRLLPSADRLNGTDVSFMSPPVHFPYGFLSAGSDIDVVVDGTVVEKAYKVFLTKIQIVKSQRGASINDARW